METSWRSASRKVRSATAQVNRIGRIHGTELLGIDRTNASRMRVTQGNSSNGPCAAHDGAAKLLEGQSEAKVLPEISQRMQAR